MEILRVSRNVWGQEIIQGMSWELLPFFFGAGVVFVLGHMLYRLFLAPGKRSK